MTPAAPTVFIVDDDESVRTSLRRLVRSLGYHASAFADAHSFLQSRRSEGPGCVILDVELPDLNGLEVQRELSALGSLMPIVFLTGRGDIPTSVRAMKAGAMEFLTKPFQPEQLAQAIRAALEADARLRRERDDLAELRLRYESLTAREREVMAGVVAGLLNKQIAAELGKTEATVKEQRAHVMSKMRASSLADLVRFATRLGIVMEAAPTLPKSGAPASAGG
jgi:FixJ family two-component response regulator